MARYKRGLTQHHQHREGYFRIWCLVCEDRVSTRQETERHLLGHFLEQGDVDFHKPPPKVRRKRGTTEGK